MSAVHKLILNKILISKAIHCLCLDASHKNSIMITDLLLSGLDSHFPPSIFCLNLQENYT